MSRRFPAHRCLSALVALGFGAGEIETAMGLAYVEMALGA